MQEQADVTPQRGSTVAARKRHGDGSQEYQTVATYSSSFGESASSPNAGFFATGSWSPSHMQAFFEEVSEPVGNRNNNNNINASGPQYQSTLLAEPEQSRSEHVSIASCRSKPGTLRPEPTKYSPDLVSKMVGR